MTTLQDVLTDMHQDLEASCLKVTLIPAPEPKFSGHMIRAVIEQNPWWYRDICNSYPSQRRVRRGHLDTRVRRRDMLKLLGRLASGEMVESKYAADLVSFAEQQTCPF